MLFRAFFKTIAESSVPSTPDRFLEFQNATFRFVVSNEGAVARRTQLFDLSTSGLELQISDLGTQFQIRILSEIPSSNLAWTVVVAKTWRTGWATGADTGCAPQNGSTPLLIAAHQGSAAVVQVLLQAGAKNEAKNKVRARG